MHSSTKGSKPKLLISQSNSLLTIPTPTIIVRQVLTKKMDSFKTEPVTLWLRGSCSNHWTTNQFLAFSTNNKKRRKIYKSFLIFFGVVEIPKRSRITTKLKIEALQTLYEETFCIFRRSDKEHLFAFKNVNKLRLPLTFTVVKYSCSSHLIIESAK